MPHKGRPYPYHPMYWATEAWFYPGFVPWKMMATQVGGARPYFGCVFGSPDPMSDPAFVPDNGFFALYEFNPITDCLIQYMNVYLYKTGSGLASKAEWFFNVIYWDGSPDSQVMDQDYPQRLVLSPIFTMTIPNPDPGPAIIQYVQFYPANYEQGGSPYARVPPGPP